MDYAVLVELCAATVRIATPLLFAALGGLISERAGTFAVGVEGMMLAGAFGGAMIMFAVLNPWLGLLAAAVSGAAVGIVIAIATTRFRTDQMVTGLAVNILVLGITSFLLRGLFGGRAPVIRFPTLRALPIPYLSDLPFVGSVLFRQPALVYTALVLTAVVSVLLARTRIGLALRAAGDGPDAAFAVGIYPVRTRAAAIMVGGACAGVGGAVLSLQEVGSFTDGMINGRGFVALAAIIVGRWTPAGTLLGCLMFGLVSALELRAYGWGLPVSSYVIQMLPYLVALALLAGVGRSARMPAAIGTPFVRH